MAAPVYQTDFDRIGLAICSDVNFPEVWKSLADQGAEIVVWPSAYSACTSLQAYALRRSDFLLNKARGCRPAAEVTGRRWVRNAGGPVGI